MFIIHHSWRPLNYNKNIKYNKHVIIRITNTTYNVIILMYTIIYIKKVVHKQHTFKYHAKKNYSIK